jgi:hypothetical protein
MEAGRSSAALLKRRRRSGRCRQSAEADETDRERERGERCTSRFFGLALLRV